MSWDPEIEELFESDIGWQAYSGLDSFGNHSYVTTVTETSAHIDDVGEALGTSGTQVDDTLNSRSVWEGTIYTKVLGIRPYDKLLIPQPPAPDRIPVWVQSVDTLRDPDGPHHHVIKVTSSPPFVP